MQTGSPPPPFFCTRWNFLAELECFAFILGFVCLDCSGICRSRRRSLNHNHVNHPEPINRRALGFFTPLPITSSHRQAILKAILTLLGRITNDTNFLRFICTKREALSRALNPLPSAVPCQWQLMGVVADYSSANCFWQVVYYILTIEKDHEIDINDTDALWGETGIAFPVFSLELPV